MEPFNTLESLAAFTSFREGAGGPNDVGDALQNAVTSGEFSRSQLESVLQRARAEIFVRCGRKTNEQYDEGRRAMLAEAELYLGVARLYEIAGERIAIKFPESNIASTGEVMVGADTPSPFEKMQGMHAAAKLYRERAQELLTGQGNAWTMAVGTEPQRHRFQCLGSCPGCHQEDCHE